MMNALDQLRRQLSDVNKKHSRETFGSLKPMAELAFKVEQRFGGNVAPEKDAITKAVRQFAKSRQVESFRDAKLICYGIAIEVLPERILIISNQDLVLELLKAVESFREEPRRFRRCFQALMTAYFEYRPESKLNGHSQAFQSWENIRDFLRSGLPSLSHEPMPAWAKEVSKHPNLFTNDPCSRYGAEVLGGNLNNVQNTFHLIGIAANSWIQTTLLLATVQTACASNNETFKGYVDTLLALLSATPAIKLSGLKDILNRYARINSPKEHRALRATAIELLGNPLLVSNAPRWDTISVEAKKMVSDWLKLQLIEQFFELLSHDGATDKRRVKFWAEYVSVIENVWFVLGPRARSNWDPDFKKLRSLMGDQALNLDGSTSGNNAFVMKIGRLLIVEFGETGNAVYLFESENPPFVFRDTLHLRRDLKHSRNLGTLNHVDRWEERFRHAIYELTNRRIENQRNGFDETSTPENFERLLKAFCAERGLRYNDRRSSGGKLFVYADALNPKISGTLGQWGFVFDRRNRLWAKD
jgi:hypothetical protein